VVTASMFRVLITATIKISITTSDGTYQSTLLLTHSAVTTNLSAVTIQKAAFSALMLIIQPPTKKWLVHSTTITVANKTLSF
jgi:exopolysaccharide biosynthesis protein